MRISRLLPTACAILTMACAASVGAVADASKPVAPAKDYRLGAGDLVRINVFGSPELTTDARVSESGNITCPLIGSISVAGLSVGEAESQLAGRFVAGNFLRQPQVSLLILEYQSQKVTVMGYVAKPGLYSLRRASTVMDALAEAGGLLPQAAADSATLVRVDGTQKQLDLVALFSGDPAQNLSVTGGDRVYVPRAEQFYIYGQVQKPGQYRLERHMTVSQAISAGGGLTPRGSERRAVIKRREPNGKEKRLSVDAADELQPGDVLFIKESLF